MAEKLFRLKAVGLFRDGNVFPRVIEKGEEVHVDKQTRDKLLQSDPDNWEMLGFVVPKSTRAKSE